MNCGQCLTNLEKAEVKPKCWFGPCEVTDIMNSGLQDWIGFWWTLRAAKSVPRGHVLKMGRATDIKTASLLVEMDKTFNEIEDERRRNS